MATQHKLEYLPIEDIAPYPNNPRINDDSVDKVAASIREFGFQQPIIVDKDNYIIAGHTRYKAALKLGIKTVPCIVATELSPEQVQAYRLADNKVGETSCWDHEILGFELQDLEQAYDMAEFGFTDDEEDPGSDDHENDDLGGKPEIRCECPNCHMRFFMKDHIVKDDVDDE